MLRRNFLFCLLLFVCFSTWACEIGIDYPDYEIYHGEWKSEWVYDEEIKLWTWKDIWHESPINVSVVPVLLVHGWGNENSGPENESGEDWGNLEDELKEQGYDVWRIRYYPSNLSNKKNAAVIGNAIQDILDKGYKENGIGKINLISHSMGGLAARGYIQDMAEDCDGNIMEYKDNIAKYVIIASPMYGSYLANLLDDTSKKGVLYEHEECLDIVEEGNLWGDTEATLDLQIGSNFTWELNKRNLNKNIDYLTISGVATLDNFITHFFSDKGEYCFSNKFEQNDGIVSVRSSNMFGDDCPSILLNKFHNNIEFIGFGPEGVAYDREAGVLASLFFDDNLSYSSASPILDRNGEFYYSINGPSDNIPENLGRHGGVILNISKSEIDIDKNSVQIKDAVNKTFLLEENTYTSKYFYVNLTHKVGNYINYDTSLPIGDYSFNINGFDSGMHVNVKPYSYNLFEVSLDFDKDNFDIYTVGGTDCDDSRNLTYPGALEACNLIDDNCYLNIEDDGINETWFNESTECGIGECKSHGNLLCIFGKQNDTCSTSEPIDNITEIKIVSIVSGGFFGLFQKENIVIEKIEEKDYNCDGVMGLVSEANDNLSLSYERDNLTIRFKDGGRNLVEFEWDVYNESLNINNLSILKQDSNSSVSYILVSGLDLSSQNATKAIFMDVIANGTGICVKDEEVDFVENISSDCNGENEFWVACPGVNGNYVCNLTSDGTQYVISGLKHSGVREQETYCGDLICNGLESCSSCVSDCGSCPLEKKKTSGGGGGGGISYSLTSEVDNANISYDENGSDVDVYIEDEVGGDNVTADNQQGSSLITGAAIGLSIDGYKLYFIFTILIVLIAVFTFIKRKTSLIS